MYEFRQFAIFLIFIKISAVCNNNYQPDPPRGTPWGFNYQPEPPGGYPPPITNPHNFQPPTEKEREGTPLTFSNQFGWEGGRGSAVGVYPVM